MFDEALADPGECGIMHDWDLSVRMWHGGWQVGIIRGGLNKGGFLNVRLIHDTHGCTVRVC